ncbi:hypothetical protein AAE478_003236 [Parahypoxylon ruwenzoriense]
MPCGYLQPHLIHPVVLDGLLQANLAPFIFASRHTGQVLLPYYIEDLWISSQPPGTHDSYTISTQAQSSSIQGYETSFTALISETAQPVAHSTGFVFKPVPGKTSAISVSTIRPLAFNIDWKPDIAFLGGLQPSPDEGRDDTPRYSLSEYKDLSLFYIRRVLESTLYLDWMNHVVGARIRSDSLQNSTEHKLLTLEEVIRGRDRPEGNLIIAVGRALPQILSGSIDLFIHHN